MIVIKEKYHLLEVGIKVGRMQKYDQKDCVKIPKM